MLALRCQRISAEATLVLTGRDVEERETPLRFDAARGRWLASDAGVTLQREAVSAARQEVLRTLEEAAPLPLSPSEISDRLGKGHDAVRRLLPEMVRQGQIALVARGQYGTLPPM